MRLRMEKFIREQQAQIVAELERVDGKKFRKDEWERPNGGGGTTCVLQEGNVFEKAGLGVSVVYGSLPKPAIEKMRANHKTLDPNVESLDFTLTTPRPLPFTSTTDTLRRPTPTAHHRLGGSAAVAI